MAQKLVLKAKGLYTFPNDFSEVPEGGMTRADNVEIKREGVTESRRGFGQLPHDLAGTAHAAQMMDFDDHLIVHQDDNKISVYDSTTGFTELTGTVTQADVALGRLKHAQASNNLYMATSTGVQKLESVTGAVKASGVPPALDMSSNVEFQNTGGFLDGQKQVAYRGLWGIRDANANLIFGAPSQRVIVLNTEAAGQFKDVSFIVSIPDGITEAHFFQLYRTEQFASTVTPDDELQLVLEVNPASGDIANKLMPITDSTPDDLRGATIYTAQSQQGLAKSNYEPPFCKAITPYRTFMFYGNTMQRQQTIATLLGVGGSSGMQDGDTVKVGPDTYTGKVSPVVEPQFATNAGWTYGTGWAWNGGTFKADHTPGNTDALEQDIGVQAGDLVRIDITLSSVTAGRVDFEVGTTGTTLQIDRNGTFSFVVEAAAAGNLKIKPTSAFAGSVDDVYAYIENYTTGTFRLVTGGSSSQNIAETAESLVRVINRFATGTTAYAYYISQADELPGKMLFQSRTIGGAAFDIQTTASSQVFNPDINTAVTTTADTFKNGLYYSKSSQPEHVPLINYLLVGSSREPILSLRASRDSLFIFKTDGVFRLTGFDESNFRVETFDITSVLLAPDSVQNLNNQIYALSTQGVVAISDSGVTVLSRPIENVLLELQGANIDAVKKYTFGVGYETDRKYCLFTISQADQTKAVQCLVYNFFTSSWTKWTRGGTCGIVLAETDLMHLGLASLSTVSKERKSYTYTDFVDEWMDGVIEAAIDTTHFQLESIADIDLGDLLIQGAKYAPIVEIDAVNRIVTTDYAVTLLAGSCSIGQAIHCDLEFAPQAMGNFYITKHIREIALMFKSSFFLFAKAGFSSSLSRSTKEIRIDGQGLGSAWGQFPWGGVPWGGASYSKPIRVVVPPTKQRGAWHKVTFSCRNAYSRFQLDGIGFTFETMDERIVR